MKKLLLIVNLITFGSSGLIAGELGNTTVSLSKKYIAGITALTVFGGITYGTLRKRAQFNEIREAVEVLSAEKRNDSELQKVSLKKPLCSKKILFTKKFKRESRNKKREEVFKKILNNEDNKQYLDNYFDINANFFSKTFGYVSRWIFALFSNDAKYINSIREKLLSAPISNSVNNVSNSTSFTTEGIDITEDEDYSNILNENDNKIGTVGGSGSKITLVQLVSNETGDEYKEIVIDDDIKVRNDGVIYNERTGYTSQNNSDNFDDADFEQKEQEWERIWRKGIGDSKKPIIKVPFKFGSNAEENSGNNSENESIEDEE